MPTDPIDTVAYGRNLFIHFANSSPSPPPPKKIKAIDNCVYVFVTEYASGSYSTTQATTCDFGTSGTSGTPGTSGISSLGEQINFTVIQWLYIWNLNYS